MRSRVHESHLLVQYGLKNTFKKLENRPVLTQNHLMCQLQGHVTPGNKNSAFTELCKGQYGAARSIYVVWTGVG